MTAPLDLPALKARIAAATPGPWEWRAEGSEVHTQCSREELEASGRTWPHDIFGGAWERPRPIVESDGGVYDGPEREDGIFIASARADLPRCVEVIEALAAALEEHMALTEYFMAQSVRYGLAGSLVTDERLAHHRGFRARAQAALGQLRRGDEGGKGHHDANR